jgi:hypothetical protein
MRKEFNHIATGAQSMDRRVSLAVVIKFVMKNFGADFCDYRYDPTIGKTSRR